MVIVPWGYSLNYAHAKRDFLFTTSKRKRKAWAIIEVHHMFIGVANIILFGLRSTVLKWNLGEELYRSIYILCNMKGCEVLELNVQIDHVHLVVIIPLKLSVSTLMGVLKGRSAIRLFNKFPHVRKKLWGNSFWARGYFVDTVGVNEEIIRRYVRHQDKQDQEHEAQLSLQMM